MKTLLLTLALWASLAATAHAQPAPTDSTTGAPVVRSVLTRTGEETDRFEIGGGLVKGFFDTNGSLAYRRFLHEGSVLERSIMGEVTGTAKEHLGEGAFAVYLLFRPVKSYRESWRLRPLIEGGPSLHTVVQAASLQGLGRTRYKAQLYLKTHLYVGFEALFTRKFGLVVRGRASVPSNRPLDYAQAAILLR